MIYTLPYLPMPKRNNMFFERINTIWRTSRVTTKKDIQYRKATLYFEQVQEEHQLQQACKEVWE